MIADDFNKKKTCSTVVTGKVISTTVPSNSSYTLPRTWTTVTIPGIGNFTIDDLKELKFLKEGKEQIKKAIDFYEDHQNDSISKGFYNGLVCAGRYLGIKPEYPTHE